MTNRKKEISNQNHKEELVMGKVQPQPKGQEEHLNPKDHQEVQQVKRDGDNTFEEKKQDGKLRIPNRYLFASLLLGLMFLLVDVIHYFWDSVSYQKELYSLDKYETEQELESEHEPKMNEINKRSHRFIIAKFVLLVFASTLFFFGLIKIFMGEAFLP